jgi:hypothetical protein
MQVADNRMDFKAHPEGGDSSLGLKLVKTVVKHNLAGAVTLDRDTVRVS